MQVQEAPTVPPPRVPDGMSATITAPPGATPSSTGGTPRHRLARVVLSLAVLSVGLLGMIDLTGTEVASSAYLAAPLTVVGLGLVASAWFERAWSLAVVGAILTIALVLTTAAEEWNTSKDVTWRPISVDQMDATYTIGAGNAVLDLSAVDFSGRSVSVRVSVGAGNLTVIVPSEVDVRAEVQVDVGDATVFGERWSGIGQSERTVTNYDTDGPGGGELTMRATVDVGTLEVRR